MEYGSRNHDIKQKYSASFTAGSIVVSAGRMDKLKSGCEHWQIGSVFWAYLQNREKRLLALSCLPVRPHGKTRLPMDGFS